MCTFNTLLLPASASLAQVNEVARETLRQTFEAQGNASIEAAAGPDARSFVRTGGCDCGAGLAKLARPVDAGPMERGLRKLRAEGWSEAKIERWKAQRAATQDKREALASRRHDGVRASAEAWAELVRRILEQGVPWVGLFTHDYHGSIANERIACGAARRHAGVAAEQLLELEADVPYVFERARR